MNVTFNNPTERQTTEMGSAIAGAHDAAEMLASDPANLCPCCGTVLNLDIWELPDGKGHMMEVCECGYVRFDPNRIVVRHNVDESPDGTAAYLFGQVDGVEHDLPDDYG